MIQILLPRRCARHARACLLLVGLCAHPSFASMTVPASQVDALLGRWEGRALARGQQMAVRLDITASEAGWLARVDYPDVPVLSAEFEVQQNGEQITLRRDLPGGPVSEMRLRRDGDRLRGRFDGAGAREAELDLQRSSLPPQLLRESRIEFHNGTTALVGSVIWPDGDGPFPAVVISHGSGPGHRQQALYRTDAVRFARLGVAALYYDKRGCGESSGDFRTASLEQLAGDALAGHRVLRELPGIRATRVGVAGHSQGGWIAPLAATLSDDVAFVIATSASALGPMAQSLFHNRNAMQRAGFDPVAIEEAQALRARLYAAVRAGAIPASLEADLRNSASLPWFAASELPTPPITPISRGERALLLFEPLPIWRQVTVPVLALWGEADIHLPAGDSRRLIASALRDAGNDAVTLHVFPGLDHGFLRVRPDPAQWDFPRGSTAVDSRLQHWIRATVLGIRDN